MHVCFSPHEPDATCLHPLHFCYNDNLSILLAAQSYESVYGGDSTQAATGCLQLAVVLKKRQQYTEAGKLAVRALQINEHILGKTHETTIKNLEFLRDLSKRARDKEAWRQYYDALIERRGG